MYRVINFNGLRWFADAAFAPVCTLVRRIPCPSPPAACSWCEEVIWLHDNGILIHLSGLPTYFHHECYIRRYFGSAAHQLGDCACQGGDRCDPPALTKRQAAILAKDTLLNVPFAIRHKP